MTYIPTLILSCCYLYYKVNFLSTTFYFIGFYFALFFIQPILTYALELPILNYPVNIHKSYAYLSNVGISFFLLGNCIISKKVSKEPFININFQQKHVKRLYLFLVAVLVVVLLYVTVAVGWSTVFNGSRSQLKEVGIGGFIPQIISFLFFITFMYRQKKVKKILSILLLIFISYIFMMLFRTRSHLVNFGISALSGIYFSNQVLQKNSKVNIKKAIKQNKKKILIGFIIIFSFSVMFRFYRGSLEPGNDKSNFNLSFKDAIMLSIEDGDLGYGGTVMDLIDLVPSVHDYLHGQSYYRILFTPIPRIIWPEKLPNTQVIVASWLNPDMIGLTIPPGIIGDTYINFGYLGIVIMMIFGMFFGILDSKYNSLTLFLWSSSSMWIFHLVRGGFTNPLIIFSLILLLSTLFSKYCEGDLKNSNIKYFTF